MDKQELLESIENMGSEVSENYPHNQVVDRELVIKLVDQLDEPRKVVVPQFVANAFEKAKGDNAYAEQLITEMYDSSDEVGYWLEVPSNEKLLLRAWLDDSYEIEKEKLYVVELSNSNGKFGKGENVFLNKRDGVVFIDSRQLFVNDIKKYSQFALTEKEIKDYDARFMAFAVEVAE